MPVFTIPDDIKNKSVEEVGFGSDVTNYLKEHEFKTVREVIDRQSELPKNVLTSIKAKLIFNINL